MPVRLLAARAIAVVQIVAVIVVLGLAGALLGGIVPSLIGDESFVVSAREMQPTLQAGDLAVINPTRADTLAAGDVVTYRTPQDPDSVLTRRVLAVSSDSLGRLNLQVRGDAEPITEQVTVMPNAVLGRLQYSLPHLGLVVTFVNQTAGKLLLIGLPALLLLAETLRSRLQRRRPARTEALVAAGRRALRAGYPELALKAANGVLAIDSYNRAAWLLRLEALKVQEARVEHAAA
jgi:signal peptidase I